MGCKAIEIDELHNVIYRCTNISETHGGAHNDDIYGEWRN